MKWYKTGLDYIEFLKQFQSMKDKKFIGFRKTKRKGFEVLAKDNDGRYWYINECSFDDFNLIEDDSDAWRRMNMKSFIFYDE